VLQVENLSVHYGNIQAVRNISFTVEDNQIISLIGSNGAGKTSTLMAISGLAAKKTGNVIFNGQDITDTKPDKIVKMGISHIPEGRHVFPNLTVQDNLIMGNVGSKNGKKAEVNRLLEEQYQLFPRLKERYKQLAGTLSGGEQQMLAISRGLMGNPKLLMLDEPSMGLAPIIVDEIFELIVKLKSGGRTILLIEQNASLALSISDYAYVLDLGAITLSGKGDELMDSDEVKKAYLGF
jgi:branched-chain amino acid transport system ATP-binding protein